MESKMAQLRIGRYVVINHGRNWYVTYRGVPVGMHWTKWDAINDAKHRSWKFRNGTVKKETAGSRRAATRRITQMPMCLAVSETYRI